MRLAVADAARIMGAEVAGIASKNIARVVIDSRIVQDGDMFVALEGAALDGHRFAQEAASKGAACALVSHVVQEADLPQIVVPDAIQALTSLARWVRDSYSPLVVGITGSAGKTTTKDLLDSISRTRFSTVVSHGNFNNELGVPLTILQMKTETEVLICELGARGRGQIRELCATLRPHIGVITNVGVAHYEMFGSREAVAETKGELIAALPDGGAAVLNFDDEMVRPMSARSEARVIGYGFSSEAEIRAEKVTMDALGRPSFRLRHGGASAWVDLPIAGSHQVYNALAASAAAIALGVDLEGCRVGLEKAKVSAWRMQITTVGECVLINDAYNASPASMESALATGSSMRSGGGRLIAVLGYMAELGEIAQTEHRRLGAYAASVADMLICVGSQAGDIAQGARAAGMADVVEVPDPDAAVEAILALGLRAHDIVLVKGSRAAALEGVTEVLEERLSIGTTGVADR